MIAQIVNKNLVREVYVFRDLQNFRLEVFFVENFYQVFKSEMQKTNSKPIFEHSTFEQLVYFSEHLYFMYDSQLEKSKVLKN